MKQTHQSARTAMRFLQPHVQEIIRTVAKVAGVQVKTALQCCLEQRATDGRTRFTVPSKDGCVAAYEPRPSRW